MAGKKKVAIIEYKDGNKIVKGNAEGDNLDKFLSMMDDPDDW